MERLKREDKDRISKILDDNWDSVFKLLVDSSVDEYDVPYREVYKWELSDREKDLPNIIHTYLINDAFFDRHSLRSWIVEEIVGALLGYSNYRTIKLYQCVNQLYNLLLPIIKPYYVGLYPAKEKTDYCKIIETNISMKDGQVYDHQSRVVEADSWDEYIEMYEEYDGSPIDRFKAISEMIGNSIPKDVEILNLKYDEKHLTCDFKHKDGWIEKKLAYKCWLRY